MMLHWLLSYLTLPGTVLRAFIEHVCLKILRVPVEDTAYLQRNELCGHVEHKPVETAGKASLLCFVPGFLMLLIGAALCVPAALQMFYMGVTPVSIETGGMSVMFIVCAVLYYCGVSVLCHVFPSYEDALYLHEAFTEASPVAKVFLFLPVTIACAGAFLQRFGVFPILWIAATVCLIVFG